MPHLTVSLVTYKPEFTILAETLASVLDSPLVRKLYLIDNSPTNELLAQLPPDNRIDYEHHPENPGFGKAHNLGIRKAGGQADYHLVLNPDVRFEPAILEGMLTYLEAHPGTGLVSPKVTFPDGSLQTLCKLLPTPLDVFLRRILPGSTWVERRNLRYELRGHAYQRVAFIPYLSGCFMLIRRSVLDRVGLFDERFFMYFEDTDLCRRIASVSDTQFLPDFQIVHHYGKGSYRSFRLLRIHVGSAIRYFNKWGWIRDQQRDRLNHRTLQQFHQPPPGA